MKPQYLSASMIWRPPGRFKTKVTANPGWMSIPLLKIEWVWFWPGSWPRNVECLPSNKYLWGNGVSSYQHILDIKIPSYPVNFEHIFGSTKTEQHRTTIATVPGILWKKENNKYYILILYPYHSQSRIPKNMGNSIGNLTIRRVPWSLGGPWRAYPWLQLGPTSPSRHPGFTWSRDISCSANCFTLVSLSLSRIQNIPGNPHQALIFYGTESGGPGPKLPGSCIVLSLF